MGFNFPNSPIPGQIYSPVGGYSYVWLDGVWRMVQPSGVSAEFIASTPADLYLGFKTGPDRWVWNDKVDGSGTDIMSLSDTATLTMTKLDDGAASGPAISLHRVSTSPVLNDIMGLVSFSGMNSAAASKTYGQLYVHIVDPTSGSEDSSMVLTNTVAGAVTERLRLHATGASVNGTINSAGDITSGSASFVGTAGGAILACPAASPASCYMRPNGPLSGAGQMVVDAAGNLATAGALTAIGGLVVAVGRQDRRGQSGITGQNHNFYWNGTYIEGWIGVTNIGSIQMVSDYRIKKDVADLPSTWDQVKALRPISYKQTSFTPPASDETKAAVFQQAAERYAAQHDIPVSEVNHKDVKAEPPVQASFSESDEPQWGFIAHELQETLVPTAATGVKDMEDGVQNLNLAPVVAALTKALQEAMARIEALEAKP